MDVILTTLQWPDYTVFGIVLLISAGIGVYYRFTGGKQRTMEEYFSADRSMSVLPLAIALMVSFMSAITLLGITAENYIHGTMFALHYIGVLLGTPIAVYFYLPVFFELKLMSVYEYLERRFGKTARLLASTANFTQLLFYTGIVLFAPSLALEATTGLSSTTSILLIGIICTFYSTIGGIKAVLITDIFQAILMFGAIFCILVIAAEDLEGGLWSVWSIAYEGDRIQFNEFSFDPTVRHTWWNLTLAGCGLYLSLFGVNQVQVQRLMTVKDLKTSKKALMLSTPIVLAMGLSTCYAGLVLYAIYKDCDPLASGKISSYDKITLYFAMERMSRIPGLLGLFVSGIFSASLSTVSAMLNSLAAITLEDYVKPIYKRLGAEFPEEKSTLIGKSLAMSNGLICISVAFLARTFESLVAAAVGITGAIGGPILGIFTLGMFVESANEIGAVTGTFVALTLTTWCVFGQPKPEALRLPVTVEGCENVTLPLINSTMTSSVAGTSDDSSYFYLYRISYMWYTPMGIMITLSLGYIVSIIARKIRGDIYRESDPSLFTPLIASRIRKRRQNSEKTTNSQIFVLEPTAQTLDVFNVNK